MAWQDVLQLIVSAGGDMDKIATGKIQMATVHGKGTPEVQLHIAKLEYERQKGVKVKDEQAKWEFG